MRNCEGWEGASTLDEEIRELRDRDEDLSTEDRNIHGFELSRSMDIAESYGRIPSDSTWINQRISVHPGRMPFKAEHTESNSAIPNDGLRRELFRGPRG